MEKKRITWLWAIIFAMIYQGLFILVGSEMAFAGNVNIPEDKNVQKHWEIVVPHGSKREFISTNKIATHFSAEAADENSRSYHGLYCAMHEYLDSWNLVLESRSLTGNDITKAFAYPHTIYRYYGEARVIEEIFLPDGINGLAVRFSGKLPRDCALIPWVDMRFIWRVPRPDYKIFWLEKENTLLISRADDYFPEGRPRWLAITAGVPLNFEFAERRERRTYWRDAARRAMAEAYPFSPGSLSFTGGGRKSVIFAFGLGTDEKGALTESKIILENFKKLKKEKLDRVKGLFHKADIETSDERINRAYRWARVSMDNLIMEQRGKGIYAGFHWFPNYWGRDTFISLPGACLVTGEFDVAREILLSFMEYQERNPESPFLGRFPNIVNPDNLQYSGVDGTWWLVRAAWKYYEASRDVDFLVSTFASLRLSIEGALEKAVDSLGFLTHADHETWMDAGGEANPYTPRGNRAVEVQALFYNGLVTGVKWIEEIQKRRDLRDSSASDAGLPSNDKLDTLKSRWGAQAEKLKENFNEYFWNEDAGYLYDHLRQDGTPSEEIRPNAILAIWVTGDDLVSKKRYRRIVKTALNNICFTHGVLSLSPSDKNFHPYHLNFKEYFFDEAYHNGDTWEWLTGPMVSCLLEVGMTETAWQLMIPLVTEILDEACVGSLREIRDGVYTAGKEEFGGATSQAWSLAEFIRVFHEEFIHARLSAEAPNIKNILAQSRVSAETLGIEVDSRRVPSEWGRSFYRMPVVIVPSHGKPDSNVIVIKGILKPLSGRSAQPAKLKKLSIDSIH